MPKTGRTVKFLEVRQAVRRHRPSELLPAMARLCCTFGEPPHDMQAFRLINPWGAAVLARESILHGTEFRPSGIDEASFRKMFNLFNNVSDGRTSSTTEYLQEVMTRYAYEQFLFQESMFEEVSRAHALLVESTSELELEIISPDFWEGVLGTSLGNAVGSTFLLSVAAFKNQGHINLGWFAEDRFSAITDIWPLAGITATAERLSASVEDMRAAARAAPAPSQGLERWAFNPLTATPFIKWGEGVLLAPVPQFVLRTITPGNLYYAGIKAGGTAFARDMGRLTEHYVGRQLRLIDGATVLPEIVYTPKGGERKSADWFLILDNVVAIIEVKSARMGLTARAGDSLIASLAATLDPAVKQIERTLQEIEAGNPAFAAIPTDRPFVGIVVTAEPLYLANSGWARELLHQARIPTITASLREIEHLVDLELEALNAKLGEIAASSDETTWQLDQSVAGLPARERNPILDAAWDSYPWPAALDELDDEPQQD